MPQGSNPLLFMGLLYAYDIAKIFEFAKVEMYADDLTVYAAIYNNED